METDSSHWQKFEEFSRSDIHLVQRDWNGSSTLGWAGFFLENRYNLPDQALDRNRLKAFFSDASNTDEVCFLACMAWGRMNRRHGAAAWEHREGFLPIIREMRNAKLTRGDAYRQFYSLGTIPGMGPAYYTKLIYFSLPSNDGYIMDQWTGKSVSLLTNGRYPKVINGWISRDKNSPEVYESFCNTIDSIGALLNKSGEEIEERMFSSGGRKKGSWRQYLVTHWT